MRGWMDSISDDKWSLKNISMEGSVPVGVDDTTLSYRVPGKASLISWCHLSRVLNEGESFPGRGNSKCKGPEMAGCRVTA